jgi:hypothetical protein
MSRRVASAAEYITHVRDKLLTLRQCVCGNRKKFEDSWWTVMIACPFLRTQA